MAKSVMQSSAASNSSVVSTIEVRGASEHNLKNLDVTIDRQAISIITGVSGSGKSSLAFDTILAESQRRFFYTLSHYSRQFLDLQARPNVRYLSGLSPAISLAQRETQPSRRATVGTLTDVSELLGVILARFGEQRCPQHHQPTASLSPAEIAESLMSTWHGKTVAICVSLAEAKKGSFKAQLTAFAAKGFARAYIDGELVNLQPVPSLAREEKHTIKLAVDHIKIKPETQSRLLRSIEHALAEGDGFGECFEVNARGGLMAGSQSMHFSSRSGCSVCGYSWPRLDSRYFSANSLGRCPDCSGLGVPMAKEDEGDGDEDSLNESEAGHGVCLQCDGTGLNPHYDAIRVAERSLRELQTLPIDELHALFKSFDTHPLAQNPAFQRVREEVQAAIGRVMDVGLGYLTLSRRVRSLSGGEAQRLKLAGLLGEGLRGVLYVLDEPSQGLHPAELERIWLALDKLKQQGNTVIIVDHDESLMRHADWIIDLGPGGGARGGKLMAKFKPSEARSFAKQSLTARFLAENHESHKKPIAKGEPAAAAKTLVIEGACLHNLQIDKVRFPLGAMTVVTGVSGAGKSSLVLGTLYPCLVQAVANNEKRPAKSASKKKPKLVAKQTYRRFSGFEEVQQLSLIDRQPIAKSSVSIPASYLGVFGDVRDLYAALPDAQITGLTARSFSLSVEGGRCPECKGRGEIGLSMRFLPDARVRCPVCKGQRFRPLVLAVKYAGLSIADVLNLTLDEACEHFKNHRKILSKLLPAVELGLGYLKLGQPTASLSGGEAQRLKLVPHLMKRPGLGGVLILDEPTSGLHFEDVERLVKVLKRLTSEGATIVMTEHHSELIRAADWIVDLGPGAAAAGGQLVYEGSPAGLRGCKNSVTGRYI